MNTKHLSTGSECPPLVNGKLRIYSMRFCPYAQRAVLAGLAKGIPMDVINCNLVAKPEWLLQKNPYGKVPTIELPDGKILYESLIVAEYIDEVYKDRPLFPTDPFQKALDKIWIEEFNKVISAFYKMVMDIKSKDQDALKGHIKDFQATLVPFEKELARRGTTFFGGNTSGMLDLMIWPWFERLSIIKSFATDLFDFEAAKKDHPKLETWRNAMKNDEAVLGFIVSPEVHKEFTTSFLAGKPNYDILN